MTRVMKYEASSLLIILLITYASALRLCHTNDFHAKYLEIGAQNVKCTWQASVQNQCYSGAARLSTAMKSFVCDVKIQAGDWVQGSLLDTAFKQNIAIEAYRWINYDFATFGNHEFDYGNGLINDTIRAIAPITTWISSNVFFEGEGMDDLPIARFSNLHDICWVAALTTETMVLARVEDNVSMTDEDDSMRKAIAKCDQQDRVIAITHQGYQNDIETCRNVKEIDLIIGGHTHTNLDNGEYPVKVTRDDGSICYVTQAYAHGRYVGVLDVEFDEEGVIQLPATGYIPLDYRIALDLTVAVKVQQFNLQVIQHVQKVVGHVTDMVPGGSVACRGPMEVPGVEPVMGECAMGDLLCDAVIESVSDDLDKGLPVVCLQNGGSLRNSFNEGGVTIRDIVNVLPFGNSIVSMKLTGADIIASLKHGLSLFASDNRGGFVGGLGNLKVVTKIDGDKPMGEQVEILTVSLGGKKISETAEYMMLTNSYIADGGDGYEWNVPFEDLGTLLREAMQAYLEKHDPYDPIVMPHARLLMTGEHTESIKYATEVGEKPREMEIDRDDPPPPPPPQTEICVRDRCPAK